MLAYCLAKPGASSGSPVLGGGGQLIALHDAGGRPQDVTGKDPVLKNEGIRIPRITAGLAAHGILPVGREGFS